MIGASYVGYVQWAAASKQHPALKCIVPQVSPPASAMWNLPYENGVFTLLNNLWWLRLVDNPKGINMNTALDPVKGLKQSTKLPLSNIDDAMLGFNSKIYESWLTRNGSAKWKGWDFESQLGKIKIPALHISGWFDGDGIGTQRNWEQLARGGNKNQWLIYGPWTHFFNTTDKLGEIDFGSKSIQKSGVRFSPQSQILHHGFKPVEHLNPVATNRFKIRNLVLPNHKRRIVSD